MTSLKSLDDVDLFFRNILKVVGYSFAVGISSVFLLLVGYKIAVLLWSLR